MVVPCFDEEDSLGELHRRVATACDAAVGGNWELVLINDGSRDRTWALMTALAAGDGRVVAVDLSRNHGHQLALSAGLALARGERVLVLDADLQDPPELVGDMMAAMDAGADVVYGQRRRREGETLFKRASAAAFYRMLNRLVDVDIPRDTGDFRLMSRRVVDALVAMPESHRYVRGLVSWLGFRQVALPYDRQERYAGATKYPLRRMMAFAIDAVTSFSTVPLRVASILGLGCAALSMLLLIYALLAWAGGDTIPGWTSVIGVVLLLGSIQLVVAGIMGEYLGRLYLESKRRPLFVVREVVGGGPEPSRPSNGAESEPEPAREAAP
ncbi:MAG: glycosyltransferase family 2 protein [Azospirillaceae bacterium]